MMASHIMHGRTIITHKPFQKSLPYKEEAMFLFIADQCCKRIWYRKYLQKCCQKCHAVTERNWKICLDYWFGSIARCGKGREYQNSSKKTSEKNSLAFLDDTVSRIAPRKSIKGSTNKQILISSSKPKKRKHHSGEPDDTIFSKSKRKRN